MDNQGIGTTSLVQVGLIVKDIEQALERYCQVFGLEKPEIILTDGPELAKTTYRGRPSEARARLAFLQLGPVSLELIEPVGGPSTWQAYLDEKGEGVHHLAFNVKGTEKVVQYLGEQGIPVDQQGHYTGGMYTYLASEPQLGVTLELLENWEE
jgi:methylmalonyl-CoA/ethylmalonyl-CoA epimerase